MKRQTKLKLLGFTVLLAVFLLVNKFVLNNKIGWDLVLTGVVIVLPVTLMFKLPDREAEAKRR